MPARVVCTAILLAALLFTVAAAETAERPRPVRPGDGLVHGGPAPAAIAEVDTVYLLGDPTNPDQNPTHNGTFEDAAGLPDWSGWTHEDATDSGETHWAIVDTPPGEGQHAMWCGTHFGGDPGYGNDWHQILQFVHAVADPQLPTTVQWSCVLGYDLEPNYDYLYLQWNRGGAWETLHAYDGTRTHELVDTITYQPDDYVDGEEIQLRYLVDTDAAWSDEDGLFDSDGACWVDDITVTVDGTVIDLEDFEDQTSQRWQAPAAGQPWDFADLYTNLQDEDPCLQNHSTQVAFVDVAGQEPHPEGTPGQTWRYGPGGFIVYNGLNGPDWYIHNRVVSPALAWPVGHDGARFEFSAYLHEELGDPSVWPGIFAQWHVRSVATGDPADLEDATWRNDSFIYYGGPAYRRMQFDVGHLLEPGRTHVQVALSVVELGYLWGWIGHDGTPAPYFDDAQFKVFPYEAPAIAASATDLFNDGFPEQGLLDPDDLASNSVRLDCARNIAAAADPLVVPGDSIWVDVHVVRDGAVLVEPPRLHVRLLAEPVFDAVRTLPPGFTQQGAMITGSVAGQPTYTDGDPPALIEDRWHFDLPDTGFFYPGDVLRYYVRAADDLAGDIGVALLPADTSGFSHPEARSDYPELFTVRALPSLRWIDPWRTVPMLFWPHGLDADARAAWLDALAEYDLELGRDYDMFVTNSPSARLGNGLGGRATVDLLDEYEILAYSSGDLGLQSLSGPLDPYDPSDDIGLIGQWLDRSWNRALFMGDDLVSGLVEQGPPGTGFLAQYLGAELVHRDVRPLIGGQAAPDVLPIAGNDVFIIAERWIAYGGCPRLNTFDAVEVLSGAERVAEFAGPGGDGGVYPYAAAWSVENLSDDFRVVGVPYDLAWVNTPEGHDPYRPGWEARTEVLFEILLYLDYPFPPGPPPGVDDLPTAVTTASCAPNPFNPRATIHLRLAQSGHVNLAIYDVRGRRVRELLDDHLAAGEHALVWDGRSDAGADAASGIYFYELRAPDRTLVNRMALIR